MIEKINHLCTQAKQLNLLTETDAPYIKNQICAILKIDCAETDGLETAANVGADYVRPQPSSENILSKKQQTLPQSNPELSSIPHLLSSIAAEAVTRGLIPDLEHQKDALTASIMNLFLPLPSQLNSNFWQDYKTSPKTATDNFYTLSQNSDYIKTEDIARNISYKSPTEYGDIDITINLSKPEKDPEDIAAEKTKIQSDYPKCMLCIENEGYAGRLGYPARHNHRMIRLDLTSEPWFFQYSPYSYYNEHCIVLAKDHTPMLTDRRTFERILEFVDLFPHYFLGANADLPIVGGSILNHNHFQGGRYVFTMELAGSAYDFALPQFPAVTFSIIKWPMSAIRLTGQNKNDLTDAADHIHTAWKSYSDAAAQILSHTGHTPHNTTTAIARKKGAAYHLDLVLRNNRTTPELPLGIFHPHQDVWHIKKENIGLIEVMGLAVLPGRLLPELEEVKKYIFQQPNQIRPYHKDWANVIKQNYPDITPDNIDRILRREIAQIFLKVLEYCAVFKDMDAFKKFIQVL